MRGVSGGAIIDKGGGVWLDLAGLLLVGREGSMMRRELH